MIKIIDRKPMIETIDQLRDRAELLAEITRMEASAEWQAVVASSTW